VSHDSGHWVPVTEWRQRYLPCHHPALYVAENLGRFLVQNEWKWKLHIPLRVILVVICNHCGVTAAEAAKHNFFGKKQLLTVKFWKFCLKVFIATPINVLCWNFVKFGQMEISEIVHCLPDQKQNFAWLSSYCYCGDRAQNLPGHGPQQCTQSAPDFIQIGSLSAEL